MPAREATRGGYLGVHTDPCPTCGETYDRFYPPGVKIVREASSVEYHILEEQVRGFEPGIYIHDGDSEERGIHPLDRGQVDVISILMGLWAATILFTAVYVLGVAL